MIRCESQKTREDMKMIPRHFDLGTRKNKLKDIYYIWRKNKHKYFRLLVVPKSYREH